MRFFRLATVVAAAASVASAMVETSDPLDSAAEVHRVYSRAGQTGCTCYGYTYFIQGMYNNNYINLLYAYNMAVPGLTAKNTQGWCFQNGGMLPSFVAQITTSLTSKVQTPYVNYTWAKAFCDKTFTTWTPSQCATQIGSNFAALIVPNYINTCNYPTTTTNWVPNDCNCGFLCTNGFVQCGTQCINPATQSCVSGVPKNRRRDVAGLKGRWNGCPDGYSRCSTGNRRGAFECVDVNSHIEACGACPFDEASLDCTSLPGVADVECAKGQCVVRKCDRKHKNVNGTCVPLPPSLSKRNQLLQGGKVDMRV